jgi:prophage regulatory protein
MKFLRWDDLKKAGHPFSRVHTARLEKQGRFPRHVRLAPNTIAWVEAEYLEYQQRCIAERDVAISE